MSIQYVGEFWRTGNRGLLQVESKDWRKRHPTGPVHWDYMCPHCKEVFKDISNTVDEKIMYKNHLIVCTINNIAS